MSFVKGVGCLGTNKERYFLNVALTWGPLNAVSLAASL